MKNQNNSNAKPQPAVSSSGATASAGSPEATTGQADNALASQRMPLQTEAILAEGAVTTQPEPPRMSSYHPDLVPDGATDDDTEQDEAGPAEPGSDDGRPANFVRRPFGGHLPKLGGGQRPGYRRYWFNDRPGRIKEAKDAGYTHVNEGGQPVRRTVTGGGLLSYFMEIPLKWFNEDMKAQQAHVDEIDRAIRAGNIKRTEGDSRYVPQNAIKIQNE